MAALAIWETPADYAGFNPVGHVVVATRTRDSDSLTRSNWEAARARLAEAAGVDAVPADADDQPVYDWRASHWACGWVEYLMVRPDAPQAVRDEAQAIADALEDYPALDEDAWSAIEYEEACDYWSDMSVRERAQLIRETRCGASLFAARRDSLPQDDSGILFDYLRS